MKENKKGITLVALVITIVIILIIAGISVAILTGEDGLIEKVEESAEETEYAKIVEELDLVWQDTLVEKVKNNFSNEEVANYLEKELQKEDEDATVKYVEENNKYEIHYKGNEFEKDATNSSSNENENNQKIEIIKDPDNISIIEGSSATFRVIAKGEGALTYQWYKNMSNSTSGGTKIEGATGSSYTTPVATTRDNGTYYYCIVTQKYGNDTYNATSNTALLTVVSKLSITKNPMAVSVIAGKTSVSFTVAASGTGNLNYQWYYATSSTGGGNIISGATQPTYTISASNVTNDLNGRYYYCVVTQTYSGQTANVTSNKALLTVVAPVTITTQPSNVTVVTGNMATFKVVANGIGTLTYQWYKNTSNSNSGGSAISGATSSTYTKITETTDDGKYYYCVVTQKYGNMTTTVSSNAVLLTLVENVKIITQPKSQNKIEGNSVTFSVTATGGETLSYQWYTNTTNSNTGGSAILGATSNSYTKITEITDNGKYYYCVVTQTYNGQTLTATSNAVLLTVVSKVSIIEQPTAVSIVAGKTSVNFNVTASGIGDLSYQWYYTTSITGTGIPISEATSNTYTISASSTTTSLNGRYYYCVVTQSYNGQTATTTSNKALLTVISPVSITTQPSSVSTYVGGASATFEIIATGNGNLKYQWYKNTTNSNSGGMLISGATESTYTIPTASITTSLNNTYYYCVVTQTYGSPTSATVIATSTVAKLTVNSTDISASPSNVIAYVGGENKTVTISGINAGTLSIVDYPDNTYATASLNGTTLTIIPKAEGITSVTIKEANGNNTITISITVKETSISTNTTSVTAYSRGENKTVTISGINAGTLSIVDYPDSTYATASLNGSTLAITPKSAGTTSVTIKEANGNKTVVISINIIETPTLSITGEHMKNYVESNTNFTAIPGGTYSSVTYQWYYNTNNTAGSGTIGGTSNTYSFSISTAGTYYISCKATYTYDSAAITITSTTKSIITVAAPTISISPTSGTIVAGSSINLTAKVLGTYDSISYQWYYNTSNAAGSGIVGGTSSEYTFKTNVDGTYYLSCEIVCTYGGTKTIISRTVKIIVQPAYYSITSGTITIYYNTLATACAGATTGQTIKVLKNVSDNSTVTIGKNIYLNLQTYTITRTATITVNSGYTLYLQGTGKITNSSTDTITNNGTLNISTSVTVENTHTSIYVADTVGAINNTGTITISNGTISGRRLGIYNSFGTINMSGGTVITTDTTQGYAVQSAGPFNTNSKKSTLNITGGKIIGGLYGIYNSGSVSYVTIGSSTTPLDKTTPYVSGGKYGIYNLGVWNFYNGILKGTTLPYNANPKEIRVNSIIKQSQEGDYEVAYLNETLIPGTRYDEDTDIVLNGEKITMPGGATVSGIPGEYEDLDNGIVIYIIPKGEIPDWTSDEDLDGILDVQEKYDQFVWVPVRNAILDLSGNAIVLSSDEKIKAEVQKEIDAGRYPMAIKKDATNYIGVLYGYEEATDIDGNKYVKIKPDTSWTPISLTGSAREPDIVLDYDNNTQYLNQINGILNTKYSNSTSFKDNLQADFNNMVTRVASKGGFWVGRYETSQMSDSTTTTYAKENEIKVGVKRGTTEGINNVTWHRMYAQEKIYKKLVLTESEKIASSMIWGSQWNQIMIWMKQIKNEAKDSFYIVNSLTMGNLHTDDDIDLNLAPTGNSEKYKVKNVFDLAGNVQDWTLECTSTGYRIERGGSYNMR